MSVDDSAEEFISILERERLLALSCGLPSYPLTILFFARLETIESFCFRFLHRPINVLFIRSLIGARHKSPAVE